MLHISIFFCLDYFEDKKIRVVSPKVTSNIKRYFKQIINHKL